MPPTESREAEGVFLEQREPNGARRVVLEDDGRTAYAYLLQEERVTADVWLYDVGVDPETVDFRNPSGVPFQNPKQYCAADRLPRLTDASRVSCRWLPAVVEIDVDGVVWARLEPGSRPGWSRGVAVANPLAKPLDVG